MFGSNLAADAVRVLRATAKNAIAAVAPGVYARLTGETGRGRRPETPEGTAAYFISVVEELERRVFPAATGAALWTGLRVLEYGPGDCPGAALALLARGAERVVCVDRFPLVRPKPAVVATLAALLERFTPEERRRAADAFATPGDPASGFDPRRLAYVVNGRGCSDAADAFDVACSRAVFEHVADPRRTFDDMRRALRADGVAAHLVDLKSHGLHRENPLDFLTWPEGLWKLMYGSRGAPNRLRIDRYRDAARDAGFADVRFETVESFRPEDLAAVRAALDAPFRKLSDEDLLVAGFWLVARRPA